MTESAVIPVGLGMLGIGGVLIASGVTGNSLADILGGNFSRTASTSTDTGGGSASSTGSGGSGAGTPAQVQKLFETMDAMVGRSYVYGGGHGGYNASDHWDCSGAVSYALHVAGLHTGPPIVSGLFMGWGKSGAGQFFTVFANPTHVFIRSEFANRKGQVWSADHPGKGGETNWRPGNTFDTRVYAARHYPGL